MEIAQLPVIISRWKRFGIRAHAKQSVVVSDNTAPAVSLRALLGMPPPIRLASVQQLIL